MSAQFELKQSTDGRYLFNLKAGNGEIVLTSSIHDTKESATAAIAAVRASVTRDANFERKVGTNEQPYFVLRSPGGDVLGRSEMYSSTRAMEGGINSVVRNAPGAALQDVTELEAEPAHR